MAAAEDPIVIIIEREWIRKVRQAGGAGAGLGAVSAIAAVAIYTNTNILSVVVAEYAFQWAIAIGILAALVAVLYVGVRS